MLTWSGPVVAAVDSLADSKKRKNPPTLKNPVTSLKKTIFATSIKCLD